MREIAPLGQLVYWLAVTFVTLLVFYLAAAHEPPLYILLVPIALATFGVLAVQRSWYGLAVALGIVLVMVVPYWLRTYGGY